MIIGYHNLNQASFLHRNTQFYTDPLIGSAVEDETSSALDRPLLHTDQTEALTFLTLCLLKPASIVPHHDIQHPRLSVHRYIHPACTGMTGTVRQGFLDYPEYVQTLFVSNL